MAGRCANCLRMKVDARKIFKRLKGDTDRAPTNLYLSKQVYKDFKAECSKAEVSSSKVLEELMKEFVDSARKENEKS
jgi:hypothetical protein